MEAEAIAIASANGLDPVLFREVVRCESHFIKDAAGDGGHSIGVVQIHLPSHPEVSHADAENPAFALQWMAEQWLQGDQWMWSCWHIVQK